MVAVAISGDAGPTQGQGVVFPRGTGVASLAAQLRRPVTTPNLLEDDRFVLTPEVRARIERADVPLGAVGAARGARRRRSAPSRWAMWRGACSPTTTCGSPQAVADQAALSLDNARLYVEGTRRRREAEELASVARSLTETLDVAAVGRHIVDGVGPLIGAAFARLRLREPDGSLRAVAWAGRGPTSSAISTPCPRGAGIAGRAVEEGKPVWCRTSPRRADRPDRRSPPVQRQERLARACSPCRCACAVRSSARSPWATGRAACSPPPTSCSWRPSRTRPRWPSTTPASTRRRARASASCRTRRPSSSRRPSSPRWASSSRAWRTS